MEDTILDVLGLHLLQIVAPVQKIFLGQKLWGGTLLLAELFVHLNSNFLSNQITLRFDETQNEFSIHSQIFISKELEHSLLIFVVMVTSAMKKTVDEVRFGDLHEVEDMSDSCGEEKEDKPEPKEEEDLLIKFVDSDDTLDSLITVVTSHLTNLEIAESESREQSSCLPGNTSDQIHEKSPTPEQVLPLSKEVSENNELSDSNQKVENLDNGIDKVHTDVGNRSWCMDSSDFGSHETSHLLHFGFAVFNVFRTNRVGSVAEIDKWKISVGLRHLPKKLRDHESNSSHSHIHTGPLVV